MKKKIAKSSVIMTCMVLLIIHCSLSFAQIQTNPTFPLKQLSTDSVRQNDNFIQNFMNTIKTLIGSNKKYKEQTRENKYRMREIRAKNKERQAHIKQQQRENKAKIKESQANMKRQQKDYTVKLRESQARQKDQMRMLRDKSRR